MGVDTATTSHHLAKAPDDILRAADKAAPKLQRAMLAALEAMRDSLPDFEALIAAGQIDDVIRAVSDLGVPDDIYNLIRQSLTDTALATARPAAAEFTIAFNQVNPRAVRWAEQYAAQTITNIRATTRRSVNDAIVAAVQEGVAPRILARHLKNLVGLTPAHGKAVDRLFRSFDLTDPAGEAQALKAASRKADKLLRWRAETIARTNTLTAANMGQQVVWDEALDSGLLLEGTKKVWVATGDNRTCFPAGTAVTVPGGTRPIENIQPGDYVATPEGFMPVAATATKRYDGRWVAVLDSRGQITISTADHEWWSDGWVEAQHLQVGDMLQTVSDEPVHIVGVAEFGVADTYDLPTLLAELGIPLSVSDRIMPIGTIDFDSDPASDSEIDNPPPDLIFLDETIPEPGQRFTDDPFDRRLTSRSAVATHRTEPPVVITWQRTELDAAMFAVDEARRPTAHFGTMPSTRFTTSEASTAEATLTIPRVDSPTSHRAGDVTTRDRLGHGECLITYRADLLHHDTPPRLQVADPVTPTSPPQIGATRRAKRYAALFTDERIGMDAGSEVVTHRGTEHPRSGDTLWTDERFIATVTRIGVTFTAWAAGVASSHLVFDISVAGPPMYYANGILVHNCPICAVLDGETVDISAEWKVTERAVRFTRQGADFTVAETKPLPQPTTTRTPPAHPRCRCTVILEAI